MRIRALIKALGGPTFVATELGLRLATVGNWNLRNAIPPEHHIAVWRLAIAKGVHWTPPDATGLALVPDPQPEPPPQAEPPAAGPTPANDAATPSPKRARSRSQTPDPTSSAAAA